MCVILYLPVGTTLSRSDLSLMANANPDGVGWATAAGGEIVSDHEMDPDPKELYKSLRDMEAYPRLVHFRLRTHGSRSLKNVQPFVIQSETAAWAFCHNGTTEINCNNDESDSLSVARLVSHFDPIPQTLELLVNSRVVRGIYALLQHDGTFSVYPKESGHKIEDGAWVSNLTWRSISKCGGYLLGKDRYYWESRLPSRYRNL